MSAEELPTIGAHCSLERCNVNDFLPIKCHCDRVFCKDHISPESHSCSLLNATNNAPPTQPTQKLQRCAADKCNKPSLEAFVAEKSATEGRTPALCAGCGQAFCASHRDPASHACATPLAAQPVKNEAGRALLAKLDVSKTTQSVVPAKRKAPPKDPKKAAQLRQVELMKMRHKAQPADPKDKNKHVPIDQKLHLKVRAEEKNVEKIFWFSKTIIAGRALDMLASHFGVSSDTAPLYLEKPSAGEEDARIRLANDKVLSEQVEDGTELIISR